MTAQQEMASEKLHFTPVHPYLFHHKEIYEEIEGPSKYFAGVTRQAYYYLDVHGGLRVY
ncbi:hypothetical protein IIA79_05895, partial [bacterium]|nr:hypothetical protein [bacterium]